MEIKELTQYINAYLKIAVAKCGNIDDAQELCQETFLAALQYLADGKKIVNVQAWLSGVMNHKYYDALRKKYKLPTVSIETLSDNFADDVTNALTNANDIAEDAEELRRQIAFLSRIYREVIIRHYFNGESVAQISTALSIPEGTVKSRLSSGRTYIKEGMNDMEHYTKHSFEPQILNVGISGTQGINGEPYCITDGNLIAQNLLLLAYEQPVTETELAKAIGIPAAYIESTVETLVNAELMKRAGGKVYTDFIIYSHTDVVNSIQPQKTLIENNFELFWRPLQAGLNELRASSFYERLTERK